MSEPTPPASRPRGAFRLLRKPSHFILVAVFGLFAAAVVLLALTALLLTPTLPAIDHLADSRLKVPMRVYTQEGMLIGEFGEEKRIPVKIEEVPDLLIKAVLAAEDDSFYFHQGVDFLGIVRAALNNLRARRHAEGASTITMQVARNYFLTPEKTYTRKLREILLAFKIERELTKDQILELYLNKIFLGQRAYGFAAAAQVYFGKTLPELTLSEMAVLAGLPKAPSRDNPLNNPNNAQGRRDYVLSRMHKLGFIDDAAREEAQTAPVVANQHIQRFEVDAPYIAEMVRQHMFQQYDDKTYGGGFHVYTTIRGKDQIAAQKALRQGLLAYERRHGYRGPAGHEKDLDVEDVDALNEALRDYQVAGELVPAVVLEAQEKAARIYTLFGETATIEWEGLAWAHRYIDENTRGAPPQAAADVVRRGDIVYVERAAEGAWWLAQVPKVAGALVSLDPKDGAIRALAGGFDFYESKFNRVIQAERQPGSSFKPFIYSAALEHGFTAASLVSGAPIVIADVNLEDEWRPEDYSRKFHGETRLRKALALSLNLVSVRLLRALGPEAAIEHAMRFGFQRRQLPRNLSLALGTASVTPLQMASAFAVFANEGFRVEPYFIRRIEDADHKLLYEAEPLAACPGCPVDDALGDTLQVADSQAQPGSEPQADARHAPRAISPANRFIMTSILRDVVNWGTAQAAKTLGRSDLAGKTGTTNEQRDAWFCGFNDDVVAATWVGFDQPAPLGNGEVGGRAALPIWIDYMRVALEGVPERALEPPEGVVSARINSETGRVTSEEDPQGVLEYFVEGSLPGGTDSNGVSEPAPPETIRDGLF